MTIWRMRIACWIPKARNISYRFCNTHCYSTVTVVARTHFNVTLHVHCMSCLLLRQVAILSALGSKQTIIFVLSIDYVTL